MSDEVRLGDHVDIQTGFPFKSSGYVSDSNAARLLRGDNVGQGGIRWNGVKFWPIDDLSSYNQYRLDVGDVVLAMDRPWIKAGLKFAEIRKEDTPSLLVQRVARLRSRASLDQRFLGYLVRSPMFTEHVLAVQTGTAVPHISTRQIEDFSFTLPAQSTQQAVGEILGALDDKIAVNDRLAKTARRLGDTFLSAAGQTTTGTGSTFGELVSENLMELGDGYRTKRAEHGRPGLPILRVAEVLDGRIEPSFDDYVSESYRRAMGGKVSRPHDLVVTTKGTVGRAALIPEGSPQFVYSPQLCYFRVPSGSWLSPEYLFYWFRSELFWSQARSRKSQTDMADYINLTDVRSLILKVPETTFYRRLCDQLTALERSATRVTMESAKLAELRDTLLPKLMSGEICVRDAEKVVEDVT